MSFQSSADFLLRAAAKYKLAPQAKASLTCERARQILKKNFPAHIGTPIKAEGNSLTMEIQNASQSSRLFMLTHEILEAFQEDSTLAHLTNIKITREKHDPFK
jgi:hypothetical protein